MHAQEFALGVATTGFDPDAARARIRANTLAQLEGPAARKSARLAEYAVKKHEVEAILDAYSMGPVRVVKRSTPGKAVIKAAEHVAPELSRRRVYSTNALQLAGVATLAGGAAYGVYHFRKEPKAMYVKYTRNGKVFRRKAPRRRH